MSDNKKAIDDLVDKTVSLMNNPDEKWESSTYTLKHSHSGSEIWIANGESYCRFYEVPIELTKDHKNKLWEASQRCLVNIQYRKLDTE